LRPFAALPDNPRCSVGVGILQTVMRWRGWAAWLVSALAHGLLAALLLLRVRTPEAPVPALPTPLEIEITEVSRPRADGPSSSGVDERSPPTRRRSVGPRVDQSISPDGVAPHDAPQPAGDAPGPAGEGPGPAGEAQPSLSDRSPGPAPNLSFRTLTPDVQARIAAPPSEAALAGGARRPSVDQLRVERERQEDAVANVAAGRADPLLYDYLRGARVRFEDEARRIAEAIPIGAGQAVRGWGRGLVRRVEEIHRGDRAADEVHPDLRTEAERQRPDLFAAYDENRRQAEAGAEIRRAEICLDVAPGKETTTTLRRGSGNAALDRVAIEAFTRSAVAQPVPPDARTGRACYEVRIATYRVGPAPGLSCDLNLFGPHGPTCVWPTKKMTSVTSQLLSVEYPAKPGAPVKGSLVRSAR